MTDTSETIESNAVSTLEACAGKYLTFELGSEVYGLEILKAQEIIGIMGNNILDSSFRLA